MIVNRMFIHGLEGSSQGFKAQLLGKIFPEMVISDFSGTLEERMEILTRLIGDRSDWIIVGSSFGGLMAALFALQNPQQVRKLVLLAPALVRRAFVGELPSPIDVPVIIYHGMQDDVIPLDPTRQIAKKIFKNLTFNVVDDDHGLHRTVQSIDWLNLLA